MKKTLLLVCPILFAVNTMVGQSNVAFYTGYDNLTAGKLRTDIVYNNSGDRNREITKERYSRFKLGFNFERIYGGRVSGYWGVDLDFGFPKKQTYSAINYNTYEVKQYKVKEFVSKGELCYGLNVSVYGDIEDDDLAIMLTGSLGYLVGWTRTNFMDKNLDLSEYSSEIQDHNGYNSNYSGEESVFAYDFGGVGTIGVSAQYLINGDDLYLYSSIKYKKYWTSFEEADITHKSSMSLDLGIKLIIN